MKTISVKLKESGYRILVGNKMLFRLGAVVRSLRIGEDAVIITNPVVRRLYGAAVVAGLKKAGLSVKTLEVPDGERSKSAKYAFDLLQKIAAYDTQKKIFVIALGGGVIGDLAGYVAAVYRRGIPYIQIPTTLLAQIDSAIGGKVAIDLPAGKNLVGAFYQPRLVISDVGVLRTLSQRQIRNGLAEAVKYGIIADKKLFSYIEQHHKKLLSGDVKILEKVVIACSQIKAGVVMKDEKETKGIRTILNFGHTFAHAIETASGYKYYQHGEAVGLGMRMAADLSSLLRLLKKVDVAKIEAALNSVGLPAVLRGVSLPRVMQAMMHDKKFEGKKNRFVLAARIGAVKVFENVPEKLIKKVIQRRID